MMRTDQAPGEAPAEFLEIKTPIHPGARGG